MSYANAPKAQMSITSSYALERTVKHSLLLIALILTLAPQIFPQELPMTITDITPQADVQKTPAPIQVTPAMVWECEPWYDNKLVTIDGWGRFSTVEFDIDKKGNDVIKLTPLCDFPKKVITDNFWVFPESKTICVWDMLMMYVYNQNINVHDSLVPFFSRRGYFYRAFQLNPDEILLGFNGDADSLRHMVYITYNMRTKKTNFEEIGDEEPDSEQLYFQLGKYSNKFIAAEKLHDNTNNVKFFMFDYETKERTDNELTKKMSELFFRRFYEDIKFNLDKRMIISNAPGSPYSVYFVLKWDENYENVKMIPFNFLVPEGKFIAEIQEVSKNFDWVLLRISGYKGLKDEPLSKYAFMKIDENNPALFSPLVILDEYRDPRNKWRYTSFFEHPKYGTCLFFTKEDGPKGKYVSAFYKMSDIQAEIDRLQRGEGR